MKTKIVLVGGFLGAGKTMLLRAADRKLSEMGKHVGLITNDQASELVDTVFLQRTNTTVSEVSGSCFCCNFPGFIDAIANIRERKDVDAIVAEPVGSCTDLSATILQPLKDEFAGKLSVAPLSVLVDPERLANYLDGKSSGLHQSAAYILQKQLEEADLIVISKADLLSPEAVESLKKRAAREWPHATVHAVSAKNGGGLEDWLKDVLQHSESGTHLAEVDYDIYAEGEAVLGWLNTSVLLKGKAEDWDAFAKDLLNSLSRHCEELRAAIGHVKLLIETNDDFVIGNITGPQNSLHMSGSAGKGKDATMTLNARAQIDPDTLKSIVTEAISKACGINITSDFIAMKCLKPGRPNPTHRYDHVV